MKQLIPFKKNITLNQEFETITSLLLEHDYIIEDGLVKGNFKVNGSFRSTLASLVDEDFESVVPFEIALSDKIEESSVNVTIDDYKYSTNFNNTIILEVDLNLEYEEKEIYSFIDELSNVEENIRTDEFINMNDEFITKEVEEEKEEIKGNNSIEDVYSFVSEKKDFVTYKIYFVKEMDDFESISKKFNISIEELEKYNEIKELKVNDKVIIPYVF